MGGRQAFTKIEHWFLGSHAKMHQIWMKLVQEVSKSYLVKRVKRKLSKRAGECFEIGRNRGPLICWTHQNGVSIFGINSLQVRNESVYVATATSPGRAAPGIDDNMFGLGI